MARNRAHDLIGLVNAFVKGITWCEQYTLSAAVPIAVQFSGLEFILRNLPISADITTDLIQIAIASDAAGADGKKILVFSLNHSFYLNSSFV